MTSITLWNIVIVSCVERDFRHANMANSGRKNTVRKPATTPTKTGATEGEKQTMMVCNDDA